MIAIDTSLVTNTESASPSDPVFPLQAPSLKAFASYLLISFGYSFYFIFNQLFSYCVGFSSSASMGGEPHDYALVGFSGFKAFECGSLF